MNQELYEWMAPTIAAVQPFCDETIFAAGTLQGAGGWAAGISNGILFSGLFSRAPKHVRKRAGGLPDTVIVAIGPTKVFVFAYRVKRMQLDLDPPVRVWKRDDIVARSDVRRVASKVTIEVGSNGDRHELESTSMTGRLGKITKEIFRLLDDPTIGAPTAGRTEAAAPSGRKRIRLGEIADEIEAELKRLRQWMPDPPSEEEVVAGGAFGMNAVPFVTWLQVVFVKRLREVAAGEMQLPASSSVGTMAVREFDGDGGRTDRLMDLIHEVDQLANSW